MCFTCLQSNIVFYMFAISFVSHMFEIPFCVSHVCNPILRFPCLQSRVSFYMFAILFVLLLFAISFLFCMFAIPFVFQVFAIPFVCYMFAIPFVFYTLPIPFTCYMFAIPFCGLHVCSPICSLHVYNLICVITCLQSHMCFHMFAILFEFHDAIPCHMPSPWDCCCAQNVSQNVSTAVGGKVSQPTDFSLT